MTENLLICPWLCILLLLSRKAVYLLVPHTHQLVLFGLDKFHLPFKIQLNHFHLYKVFSQTLSILSFLYTLTTTAHFIINTFMLVFSYWGVVKGSSFY